MRTMKQLKNLALLILAISLAGGALAALADEPKTEAKPKSKAKPYILKTCPVSGDKLGEMGDPYVFEFEGREIKLCCKACLKDFKKNSAKYVKKIEEAEAKEKAKAKK
jgi:YHS domain-containing protein